jgi:hypothetical protein
MQQPALHITQWREFGDDEDSLSLLISTIPGFDHAAHEAKRHGLRYPSVGDDSEDEDSQDERGWLKVTHEHVIDNGQILTSPSGRKYRVNFEEVVG